MKKSLLLVLAVLCILSMVTAGYAKNEVLKISYHGAFQPHEKEFIINTFIKDFESKNKVQVEVDFISQADGIKKIKAEQDSQNIVSDVLFVDTANMPPYVGGGWVEDITKVVAGTRSTLTNMFDGTTNKEGKRYFAPVSFDVYITIANKKALKYLPKGLKEKNIVSGLTWDQYAAWAKAIAAGEGVGKTMMPANLTGSQLLYPMGGLGMAYGAKFPEFNSDGFKKAMGIIADMATGNAFYPEQAQYSAPTDPLKSGAVWLTFAHMGPVGVAYNAAPNEYVVGAAPRGPVGAGSTAGAWCFGIQKGTKNQKLAEKFIGYVLNPKVNYQYCSEMGGLLSPIKQVGKMMNPDDVIMRAGNKMLMNTIISGVPSSQFTDWNAVKLLYGELFNKILKDKAVPGDPFFTDLQARLEKLRK